MARSPLLALPLFLAAAPAAALTPEELWSAWQAQAQGFGVTLGAEAVPGEGGALTLRNWTRAGAGGPVEPLPADVPVQELVLTPTGDGGVVIELPGLPASTVIPEGVDAETDLRLDQEGLRIVARDGTDAIEYEVTADSLRAVTLFEPGNTYATDFAAEVWGVALRLPGDIGPDRRVEASLSVEGFAYVAGSADPTSPWGSSTATRSEGRIALDLGLTLPEGVTFETLENLEFADALERGLALQVDLGTGAGRQVSSFEGFPFSYRTESTLVPGTGSLALDRAGFALFGEYGGGSYSLSSEDLPFPSFEVSHGPIRAEIRVPLGPQVGDLRYLLSLEDLAVDAAAWDAVDPQGLLPREPFSLLIDVGGRMSFDVAAMEAAERAGMTPPPAVESIRIDAFEVSGAGLRAAATGSMGFDPATMTPLPGGRAEVTLEGVDRLLDALVSMGWITDMDALGARAGLAVAFRPTGPDRRESVIEVRDDGQVYANGALIPVQ